MKLTRTELKKIMDTRYTLSLSMLQKGTVALDVVNSISGGHVKLDVPAKPELRRSLRGSGSYSKSNDAFDNESVHQQAPNKNRYVSSRGRIRKPKVIGGYDYAPLKILSRPTDTALESDNNFEHGQTKTSAITSPSPGSSSSSKPVS